MPVKQPPKEEEDRAIAQLAHQALLRDDVEKLIHADHKERELTLRSPFLRHASSKLSRTYESLRTRAKRKGHCYELCHAVAQERKRAGKGFVSELARKPQDLSHLFDSDDEDGKAKDDLSRLLGEDDQGIIDQDESEDGATDSCRTQPEEDDQRPDRGGERQRDEGCQVGQKRRREEQDGFSTPSKRPRVDSDSPINALTSAAQLFISLLSSGD